MRHEDYWVRAEAAKALGEIQPDSVEASRALKPLLKDEYPSVRKAAAEALKKISVPSKAE